MEIANVAGVRFRNAGKIAYYYTAGLRLETGEYVVVETNRGPEVGKVVIAPGQVVVNELNVDDLPPILRLATDEDLRRADSLRTRADEVLPEARRLAAELGFPAHIDAADFTLDARRLTFSFTSEERLDYREFLRKASDRFGTRIDMRQIGARDRAKLAGGYGICGRELCCSNWLSSFPSISIKMAKEQELPLNPQKISGLCGRLLCCLSYEEEGYREMRRTLPRIGQRCSTPTGEGKVIAVNILRRQITLYVPDVGRVEVSDRDLGTVVRWDTASKSAEPPPSITRAQGIAEGLIEADEIDIRQAAGIEEEEPEPFDKPGRGRLPQRQQTRRLPQPGAAPASPQSPPQRRDPRPAGRRPGPGQQPPNEPGAGPGPARGQRQRGGPPPAARPESDRPSQPVAPRGQRPAPPRPERPQLPGAARVFQRSRPPAAERPERAERAARAPEANQDTPDEQPSAPRRPRPPRNRSQAPEGGTENPENSGD